MVLNMPEALVLSSSADNMSELPQQAFALTLSDNMIEDMIACVQKGQEIQLSLGDTPVSYCIFMACLIVNLLLGYHSLSAEASKWCCGLSAGKVMGRRALRS
jgi:hypothetical protein